MATQQIVKGAACTPVDLIDAMEILYRQQAIGLRHAGTVECSVIDQRNVVRPTPTMVFVHLETVTAMVPVWWWQYYYL